MYSIFISKYKHYKEYRKGFEIGKRAAQGYNVYLTFGSRKTVTRDAQDSYKRYAMAMNHYEQILCNKKGFYDGYNKVNP